MLIRTLVLGTCLGIAAATAQDRGPEARLVREIYEELVEIDTTHATGSTTRAAAAVAARLRKAGFAGGAIRELGPSPTKGNLVVRLAGRGAATPLVLLAHLDVVAAPREDWSTDPFVLEERDGFFQARGTLDDKAMAAIFVAQMISLRTSGAEPNRDVILALTADEEGGPENGVRWLLANHPDLVDAGLVLNEGGLGVSRHGKRRYNELQASEKTYANFRLAVRDSGGHSSVPRAGNAIYRLAAALQRLDRHVFPVELNAVTRMFFARLATLESGRLASDLAAIEKNPRNAVVAARLAETPRFNALLRTTCVATRLDGGHADNALPQSATANVNCRILPGHAVEEVEGVLRTVIADPAVSIARGVVDDPAPASPLEPAIVEAIEAETRASWPGVPVVPTMSTGATDSRFFRQRGIAAYGVSGLFVDFDDNRTHGRDERLGIEAFYEGHAFLDRLIRRLVGLPPR